MALMSTENLKVNLDEVTVREATAEDYDGVVAIQDDAFAGFDFLPALYHWYLHHPDIYMFVAEWKGRIIAFTALWMLEDRTFSLGIATRVVKEYIGQAVFTKFDYYTLPAERLEKPFYIGGASWWKDRLYTPEMVVKRRYELLKLWRNMGYVTAAEDVHTEVRNPQYTHKVESFGVAKTLKLLLRPDITRLLLAEGGIIIAFNQWVPVQVTPKNLNWLAKATDRVQFTFEGEKCVAVSFCFQLPTGKGSHLVDVTYHGKEDVTLCTSHIVAYLKYMNTKRVLCDKYLIMLNLPWNMNEDEMEKAMKPIIGERIREEPFNESRSVIYRKKRMYKPNNAKL